MVDFLKNTLCVSVCVCVCTCVHVCVCCVLCVLCVLCSLPHHPLSPSWHLGKSLRTYTIRKLQLVGHSGGGEAGPTHPPSLCRALCRCVWVFQKRAYSPDGNFVTFGNMSRAERNKLVRTRTQLPRTLCKPPTILHSPKTSTCAHMSEAWAFSSVYLRV